MLSLLIFFPNIFPALSAQSFAFLLPDKTPDWPEFSSDLSETFQSVFHKIVGYWVLVSMLNHHKIP